MRRRVYTANSLVVLVGDKKVVVLIDRQAGWEIELRLGGCAAVAGKARYSGSRVSAQRAARVYHEHRIQCRNSDVGVSGAIPHRRSRLRQVSIGRKVGLWATAGDGVDGIYIYLSRGTKSGQRHDNQKPERSSHSSISLECQSRQRR